MHLRPLLLAALIGTLGGAAASAAAADTAGIVKRLQGTVSLQRDGQTLPLAPGSAVQVGDRLVTGPDGAVGVTLADDTLLTAGPGSTLVVSEFRFNSTTNEGSLLASLWKGTLNVVTGLIAKQAPQNVNVQTRNAVMGVRGTDFIVDARGDAP
ncbi:MAG: FecR domain-containing protein [Rubrivivax sp.]